jgi:glycosyltransferase 2 family protein
MKKTATMALKIGVSLALYAYIFRKVNIGQLWSTIKSSSPSWIITAILIYVVVQALSAYRWYVLLKPLQIRVPFIKILGFYLVGMYCNLLLPSSIGGDVVKIYYLNKEAQTLSGATASVFLDRDFGLAALLVMATAIAAVSGTSLKQVPLAPMFGLITLAFAAANLALFYRPTYSLLHRFLKLLKLKESDEKVERLFQSVNSYRGQYGVLAMAFLLSFAVQVGVTLVNMAGGAGIDLHTSHGLTDYFVYIPAISLIGMNPISINGMGWREAAYVFLFTSAGVTEPKAVTLALIWLAVLVLTSLPGGIIYIMMQTPNKGSAAPPVKSELAPDAVSEG